MVIPTRLIITAAFHLAVGAAGHGRADTILDGDSLDGRGGAQGDGLLILQALVGRGRAVHGVEDRCSCRTAHGHLGRIRERGAADNVDAGQINS